MAEVWAIVKGMVLDPLQTVPRAARREGWGAPMGIFCVIHLVEAALTAAIFMRWPEEVRGALRALGYLTVPGAESALRLLARPAVPFAGFLIAMALYWVVIIGVSHLIARRFFRASGSPFTVLRTCGYMVVIDSLWALGMLLGVLSPLGVPMWALFGLSATTWQIWIFADIVRVVYGLTPSQAFQCVVLGVLGAVFQPLILSEFAYCVLSR